MHRYLWEGRDPDGTWRSERVEAENATEARADLTRRGWSELRLIMDEIADVAAQNISVPEDVAQESTPSPTEEVAIFRGQAPGFLGQWVKSVWDDKWINLVALGLTLTGFFLGHGKFACSGK